MSEWSSAFVNANGIRIHYARTGGSKPILVLAHGITDSGLCWTRLAHDLEQDYDVLMVNARGHGLSETPEGGYDWATLVEDLAAAIRALGIERAGPRTTGPYP
ncbi:MAG: alpha/beta fold hydrolase [Anaerolineae bacterium]